MANFKKTGDFYVSKGGDNGNDGLTADTPKLTIQEAINVSSSNTKIIVGDGTYDEANLIFGVKQNVIIEADGIVIFENDKTGDLLTNLINISDDKIYIQFIGFVVVNYRYTLNATNRNNLLFFKECTFINSPFFGRKGSNQVACLLLGCKFINSSYNVISQLQIITNIFAESLRTDSCIFINTTYYSNTKIIDSFYDDQSNIEYDSTPVTSTGAIQDKQNSDFNCINSTITYETVFYSNLQAFQAANPAINQNSINEQANFNRISNEILTLDFSVKGSSPLLFAGSGGKNIGNVKRGLQIWRNSDAVQNGVLSQIVFNGNIWQIQGENATGFIITDTIDFGLTVRSPKLTIKGLVNFLDNVPDFDNSLLNPNKLDIEAKWAVTGEDITAKSYVPFLLNERMVLDGTGKSNGQSGFEWDNLALIPMRFIQLRITLRQNYNPA